MSTILRNGLIAAVVVTSVLSLSSRFAAADEQPVQFRSLSTQMLEGAGIDDNSSAGFGRFNSDTNGTNVAPFTLEDYQHKPTFDDVKDSFGTFLGSVAGFFGNLFGFMAHYKLIVPAILILVGIGKLFGK